MAVRIGGQAVIEGVMMKNIDRYAVSVRKPDGKIETKVEECVSFAEKHPLFKLPILRGMVNFLESMVIGMQTLNYSASFYEDAEEQVDECRQYTVEEIFCCAYAPYFWQAIQIRYPEYATYNHKLYALLGGTD